MTMSAFLIQDCLANFLGFYCCGWLFLASIPNSYHNDLRLLCVFLSIVSVIICFELWYFFDCSTYNFQFIYSWSVIKNYNIGLSLGVDGLSLCFLLLTVCVFPLCFFSTWSLHVTRLKEFLLYLSLLEFFLILCFVATDLVFFYVFFESVLIPMFIIIGIWGSRERKIKAAYYLFLYTLFGSFFLLFGIIYVYTIFSTTTLTVLLNGFLTYEQQCQLWFCFFIPFAVKIPMFPFHIWLPEAHVEAPTVGSVILASLLLKLGSYGFLRFTVTMFPQACQTFDFIIYPLAIISIIFASLSTIRQIDIKRIIAYSSIAHMNIMVLGLFSFNTHGIDGAIYLMLAHGIVSSGLFFCVGFLYDRSHSRLLRYFGGLATVMPFLSIFFFLFTLANMGFPGTSNFVGELLVFIAMFDKNIFILIFSASSIVLAAVYAIWLFNRLFFGSLKLLYISKCTDLCVRELLVLSILVVLMFLFGINSSLILDLVNVFSQHLSLLCV